MGVGCGPGAPSFSFSFCAFLRTFGTLGLGTARLKRILLGRAGSCLVFISFPRLSGVADNVVGAFLRSFVCLSLV